MSNLPEPTAAIGATMVPCPCCGGGCLTCSGSNRKEATEYCLRLIEKSYNQGWQDAISKVGREVATYITLMYKDTKKGEYACQEIGKLAQIICHLNPDTETEKPNDH